MVKPVTARDLEDQAARRSLSDLADEASDVLSRSYITEDDAERTRLYERAALLIAQARALFVTKTGDPDWAGRSYAYREWTRGVYSTAIPKVDRDRVRGAVAWHVLHTLHSFLTEDELADAGLLKTTPNERAQERREDDSRVARVLISGPRVRKMEDIIFALDTILTALRRLAPVDNQQVRTLAVAVIKEAERISEQ